MKYRHNKRFLEDILYEVKRMDVVNRNCANLLACIKCDMPYDTYVSILDRLTALDGALRHAYNTLLDATSELCDTQQ